MRKGKIRVLVHQIRVLVHQLGFVKRGNCASRVICDWRLEIALRDCGGRLSFDIGASTRFRLVSLRNICVVFFVCSGFAVGFIALWFIV